MKRTVEQNENAYSSDRYIVVFKENLRYWRKERGLSQKQIAAKLGIPESTYSNWEQGRREPSISDIFGLLRVLDISADDLFPADGII